MKKDTAIVVAGGSGSRMGTEIPKQYLKLCGKPVICWCLEAFEHSSISEVILVVSEKYITYCSEKIVAGYGCRKVKQIIAGGAQRYDSVYEGLKAAAGSDYVWIHDAARPCLTQDMIVRLSEAVRQYDAVTAAVPVKDTIKSADPEGFADRTPERSRLWSIQTPQVFSYPLLRDAYEEMMRLPHNDVTDDTMVVERYAGKRVRLVEGSYYNQKITTPEDLIPAEAFLRRIFF